MRRLVPFLSRKMTETRSLTGVTARLHPSREDDLFRCTRTTWLYNKEEQLKMRCVRFNVDALVDEYVKAAGASSCLSFVKLNEGTFNRVFLATLDNRREVIARIPFPVAGPAQLATASEVATMEFARTFLDTPTPAVLAYSSSDTNRVGCEYIIMEKSPGVQLSLRWSDDPPLMPIVRLIRHLIDIEGKWTNTLFTHIGSIYFAKDLSKGTRVIDLSSQFHPHQSWGRFVMGPTVQREFWRGERHLLTIDRGPWRDIRSYLGAAIDCEIAWLERYARPHRPDSPLYRSAEENDPSFHITLLRKYKKLVPHLPDISEFSRFCLWHPDLHGPNVLVPESEDFLPAVLIDWQGATVNSLMLASEPDFLEYSTGQYITLDSPRGQPPKLPPNFDNLPKAEQQAAKIERRVAARTKIYVDETYFKNPVLYRARALSHSHRYLYHDALMNVPYTWIHGTAYLRKCLIDTCTAWSEIAPGTPYPVSMDPAEIQANEAALEEFMWDRVCDSSIIDEHIGIGSDGSVALDELSQARRRNEEELSRLLQEVPEEQRARMRRRWPRQDGAYSATAETCR